MTFPFVEANKESRQTLEALAERLSDEDLSLVTPCGWSVGALFAHMAWWDQRMLALLRRWQERGLDESPVDSEMINEALKPLCQAMDPRAAIALCLATAQETDSELAAMSPELKQVIEASANHFRFNRALHRNDHIEDIIQLLEEKENSK